MRIEAGDFTQYRAIEACSIIQKPRNQSPSLSFCKFLDSLSLIRVYLYSLCISKIVTILARRTSIDIELQYRVADNPLLFFTVMIRE